MRSLRSLIAASIATVVLLAASVGASLAAFQTAQLNPDAGPIGTPVSIHIEMSARIAGTAPGPLVLVGKQALYDNPSAARCEEIPGALVVGETAWQSATIEYAGQEYSGFVGEAEFTVPDVPAGIYHLAESIDARGTGCFTFASFTVTDTALPDTAMSKPTPAPAGCAWNARVDAKSQVSAAR